MHGMHVVWLRLEQNSRRYWLRSLETGRCASDRDEVGQVIPGKLDAAGDHVVRVGSGRPGPYSVGSTERTSQLPNRTLVPVIVLNKSCGANEVPNDVFTGTQCSTP